MATPEDVYRLFRDFKDLSKEEQVAAQNHDLGRLKAVLDKKEEILADLNQKPTDSLVPGGSRSIHPSALEAVHAQMLFHQHILSETEHFLKHQLKKLYKVQASASGASKPQASDSASHLDAQA